MMLLNNYNVTVNDIAKQIRKIGAEVDTTQAAVNLASLVFPEKADTTALFLEIDWEKEKIDLCLIENDHDSPTNPPISYDKTELELLIAFTLYLLDEIAA